MRSVAVIISHRNRSHLLYQFEDILEVNHPYETQVCFSEIQSDQWLIDQGFNVISVNLDANYSLRHFLKSYLFFF